jgi:ribosomal protein L35AE/L33A
MLTWDGHRGRHLSYQRGKRNTNPGTSLIQIEGVENTEAAKYVGGVRLQDGEVLTVILASI